MDGSKIPSMIASEDAGLNKHSLGSFFSWENKQGNF